jgi:hypothetical protein
VCGPDQSGANVVGPDLEECSVQPGQYSAVVVELSARRPVEVVGRSDVHPLEFGIGKFGEIGGVADEPLVDG